MVAVQVMAKRSHPFVYRATIIASTTAGATMADYATRSLGIGYPGGSILLTGCVMASLLAWRLKRPGSFMLSAFAAAPTRQALPSRARAWASTSGSSIGPASRRSRT